MGLTKEDRVVVKNLYLLKGYGAKKLVKEFPTKGSKTTLNDFLKQLRDTGLVEPKPVAVGQEQRAPTRTLTLWTRLC